MKKKFPFHRQLDFMDCGPTCLLMISKYYGRTYPLEYLREHSFIGKEGVSMLGISDAAEYLGFRTQGVKVTFNDLVSDSPLPCIIHWNQKHFVIVYDIKQTNKRALFKKNSENEYSIKVADPSLGLLTYSHKEFLKGWTGYEHSDENSGIALLLVPTPDFYLHEQEKNDDKIVSRNVSYYLKYIIPYRSQVVQLIIGMLLGSLLALILPFLTQAVVDQGVKNNNLNLISLILIAQFVLFLTQLAIEFIRNWIVLHVNTRVSISLISDFLIKLMKLPLKYFDSRNIGDILRRIADNDRIKTFLTGTTLTTLFSLGNFFMFGIILFYYNVNILSVFFIGNTLYVLWVMFFMKRRRNIDYKRFTLSSAEQSNLVQMITGMQEIKLNNYEKQQRWKWEGIQVKLFKIGIKGLALEQYQQLGSVFFSQTTSLLISYISARSVVNGTMTLGMMLSVSYIIAQLSSPIGNLIDFIKSAQDAKISLNRLNEIQNQKDEEADIDQKINEIPENRDLVLENVYFSYDGANRNYALENINLVIPQNKITAIVGGSGSGKTTLIKLLLNFYAPTQGSIKVGQISLNKINPHLWRQRTGSVMQEGFVFSDTILNNIVLGDENVSKSKVMKAVDTANIREFIENLPMEFNSVIGAEGKGISQGQKQRLFIARAVYKNPDFIFLDEATNALDANNERVILDNLNDFYKGKTVIIVAHRLSTVQHADNIVVLEQGKIVEQGTHKNLISKKGAYYKLVKNQLELGN
ncbi:MAG: peptidase domain-containing ABC transporter [Dysgonamonadaceae bacterium]